LLIVLLLLLDHSLNPRPFLDIAMDPCLNPDLDFFMRDFDHLMESVLDPELDLKN